jgi:hypothetical protein
MGKGPHLGQKAAQLRTQGLDYGHRCLLLCVSKKEEEEEETLIRKDVWPDQK